MGFFIVVLIFLLLPFVLPKIGQWIKRYFMGKMEDRMRSMMGMPTRAEERRARKEQERRARDTERKDNGSRRYGFRRGERNHNVGNPAESIRVMKMYAEDVEFVEIREYSAEIRFEQEAGRTRMKIVYEEQVSDAEFVVVR